jgi:hypothetical protein
MKEGIIMVRQVSFTKHENKALPNFRQMISKAESTEDVKKFFVYTAKKLFESIFEGKIDFEYEDFALTQNRAPYYRLSERVISLESFRFVWNDSDLSRVLCRFAESAMRRCRHLEKHPEKTDAKIRI